MKLMKIIIITMFFFSVCWVAYRKGDVNSRETYARFDSIGGVSFDMKLLTDDSESGSRVVLERLENTFEDIKGNPTDYNLEMLERFLEYAHMKLD